MDTPTVVSAVFKDLQAVSTTYPNERLPKEEQIRCALYMAMQSCFDVVCVERGYGSIDDGNRAECDIWARTGEEAQSWLELKRCWSVKGWINKPPEQLTYWNADLEKLATVGVQSDRYFLLVGFFDCDPVGKSVEDSSGVVANIKRFHPNKLVYRDSVAFSWRQDDGISHAAAFVWHWTNGESIQRMGSPDAD
jgi:hypothetical protein